MQSIVIIDAVISNIKRNFIIIFICMFLGLFAGFKFAANNNKEIITAIVQVNKLNITADGLSVGLPFNNLPAFNIQVGIAVLADSGKSCQKLESKNQFEISQYYTDEYINIYKINLDKKYDDFKYTCFNHVITSLSKTYDKNFKQIEQIITEDTQNKNRLTSPLVKILKLRSVGIGIVSEPEIVNLDLSLKKKIAILLMGAISGIGLAVLIIFIRFSLNEKNK